MQLSLTDNILLAGIVITHRRGVHLNAVTIILCRELAPLKACSLVPIPQVRLRHALGRPKRFNHWRRAPFLHHTSTPSAFLLK